MTALLHLPEFSRIVECPNCDSGRVYHGHPNDPEPRSSVCFVCNGEGEIEVDAEPVTLADIEELAEQEAR